MRVVLLGSGSLDSSLSARLVNLGRELVQRGWDVTIMVPAGDKYNGNSRTTVARAFGMTVIHPRQFRTRFASVNFLPYLPSAVFALLRLEADIVHIYKPTPLTIVGLIKAVRGRTKIVLDMDDLGAVVMAREGNPRWKTELVKLSESLAARLANGIVTASSYLESRYRQQFPKKPIVWVPNGVRGITRSQSKPPTQARIVYIGSLNNRVSVMPLLESLPAVIRALAPRRVSVQVIGSGTELEALTRHITTVGLSDVVSFLGWIDRTDIGKFASSGSVGYCCVPDTQAFRAASNQKVFDYLSLGIAPLVSAVGDLPFYVDHGRAGYIVDGDLATAVAAALADTATLTAKIDAGRRYLESHFLWPILAGQIEDLYSSLLTPTVTYT